MAAESPNTTTIVNRPSASASLGLLLGRLPLGLFFLMAGIEKFYSGVNGFVSMNLPKAMRFLPEKWAGDFLHAVPYIEIVVGSLLIIGLISRAAAAVMAIMLVIITVGATTLSSGSAGGPFHFNMVFLGLALALMLCGPGRISLDGWLFPRRNRVVISEAVEPKAAP